MGHITRNDILDITNKAFQILENEKRNVSICYDGNRKKLYCSDMFGYDPGDIIIETIVKSPSSKIFKNTPEIIEARLNIRLQQIREKLPELNL